jgi:hypothetical protein
MVLSNASDFFIDYGEPNINYGGKAFGQGKYVAANFLKQSDSLYVVRVTAEDADFANLAIVAGLDGTTQWVDATSIDNLTNERELLSNIYGDESPDNLVVFHGVGRGEWYNNFKISIKPVINTAKSALGVYSLDLYQRQGEDEWDDDLEVFVPQYEITNSFEISFNPEMKDSEGDSMFIEDVFNKYSRFVKCKANRYLCSLYAANDYDFSEPFVDLDTTEILGSTVYNAYNGLDLAEGSDGDTLTYGTAKQLLSQAYQGVLPKCWGNVKYTEDGNWDSTATVSDLYVDEVFDVEFYYFNIVMDAGYPSDVKTQIVSLVKDLRQDCIAVIDNGDNITPNDALTKRRDTHKYNDWHTAIYEPYTKIYDMYTGQDLWITPVYHLAKVIVYTENVSELWYAPAGFNRGTLDDVKEIRYPCSPGYRDQFYLNQINPIVKFAVGDTIWGQLTSQRRPTAMQDLNVVRLVLYIKRALEQFCKYYIFELNNEDTWNRIKVNIDMFLAQIQAKRGLYSYSVDVGANEYEIKSKQVHVNVRLKPTRVIERINLTFFIE